jgi:hypothetical protein
VVGFDLVEVNPLVDVRDQTSLLATTLIAEFLGSIFDQRRAAGVDSTVTPAVVRRGKRRS